MAYKANHQRGHSFSGSNSTINNRGRGSFDGSSQPKPCFLCNNTEIKVISIGVVCAKCGISREKDFPLGQQIITGIWGGNIW